MSKTLLILTGHSKGLGKAILEKFITEGDIEIVAVSRTSLGEDRPGLTEIAVDLSDLAALEMKLAEIFPKKSYERAILINNAGWIGDIQSVGKLDTPGIRRIMNLNLMAPMILSNSFVQAYSALKGEKLICNISSGAAHKPLPGWSEYCSSKAGLAMFSKVADQELSPKGFRVFSVAPGIIDTAMQEKIRQADQTEFPALDRFKAYKESGQLLSPEQVAEKIFYLLTNPDLFTGPVHDVREFELP
jgi:benzil reductase ((S)-benzoin forming)